MTERYQVIYSPVAKEDLRGIYRYIAFNLLEPEIAGNQVNRIRECIRKLDVFPQKHQKVTWEPWSSVGMRHIPVNNFIVYYLVNDEHKLVTVIRILYGGRNAEQIISDVNG
jgi:addiction module RelE/StbE family toxin